MTSILRIDDPRDPRLDDYRDLNHSDTRPDLPGGKGLVIAEGSLVIPRLVESRFPVRSILGFQPKLDTLLASLGNDLPEDIPVYEVTREVLAEVTGFDMHRGLVAAADRAPEYTVSEVIEGARTLCILEGVGDHENIGSIFRNAAGLGVDGVLFGAGCADPLYRRVVRVSMGHVLRLPYAHMEGKTTNWQHGLAQLQEQNFQIIALTPNPSAANLQDVIDPTKKTAILVGAEGPGLTEHAMRATDVRAKIPMQPGTDSLNVATAAAIGFYEALRH
ncbi:MAG: RNA methyltransferase [Corynebacterium glucuronolyticum]|nr:RNA methyltransferase [Corynebacterium glucuronolyticum]MDD7587142.1 RNA methyltransferase [Mycobacteriaceae bacterium]MDY5834829.1 RNA methyltransferase [Corynebacterium glucuronolyticum]